MSNPTTPFGWQMPQNTDLVTDLPADFEVFGQAVATSMQDLLGGTTGQVLAKASNTDMDFVWSADAAGMTNPMTTTGDTIYSSSGSTPARLGIGSTGQVLTVASGIPSWATSSSGGMTLLSTTTCSGTAVSITSISGAYNSLFIIAAGVSMSSQNSYSLYFNNFASGYTYTTITSGAFQTTRNNYGAWQLADPNIKAATTDNVFAITIDNYASTTKFKPISKWGIYTRDDNSTNQPSLAFGAFNSTSAVTQLDFYADSHTFTAGTILLYGVK